jgi:hypothetical protein
MSCTLPDPTYVFELAEYNLKKTWNVNISKCVYVLMCMCVCEHVLTCSGGMDWINTGVRVEVEGLFHYCVQSFFLSSPPSFHSLCNILYTLILLRLSPLLSSPSPTSSSDSLFSSLLLPSLPSSLHYPHLCTQHPMTCSPAVPTSSLNSLLE